MLQKTLQLTLLVGLQTALQPLAAQTTLYDFGDPSAEEQLFIELINRARADPAAEGARLAASTHPGALAAYNQYGVNLTLMQSEFAAITPAQPLAPNKDLTEAASHHSAWELANAVQAHYEGSSGSTFYSPSNRATYYGYPSTYVAENTYAYTSDVEYGHIGFEVDWGPYADGMQVGRGHRGNVHNTTMREIGIGIAAGTNSTVTPAIGPLVITQNAAAQFPSPTFGTGVAYYDLNGNNFYDIGEGIGGLSVNINGASYSCTTATGGGWAFPIPSAAATRTVSFSGLGISSTVPITNAASTNAKADLKLSYTAPVIATAATAYASTPHTINFNAIGGANAYEWTRANTAAAPAENCESTANITSSTTGTYNVLSSSYKYQGSYAFHTQNTTASAQSIVLNGTYHGGANPTISFRSSVKYATTAENMRVQVKPTGSATWTTVWSQQGTNSPESSFNLRTAPLTGMAGKTFQVRFLHDYAGGSYYTVGTIGWWFDAITFSDTSQLTNITTETLSSTTGSFTPPATGSYLMAVSPVNSGNLFPAGYQTLNVVPTPVGFAAWATSQETIHGLPSGALGSATGDHDHDGLSNLAEYAFGTNPAAPSITSPNIPTMIPSATALTLEYKLDTAKSDITMVPQATNNLGTWRTPGQSGAPSGFTDTLISTTGTMQTRRASVPHSSGNSTFLRIRISKP